MCPPTASCYKSSPTNSVTAKGVRPPSPGPSQVHVYGGMPVQATVLVLACISLGAAAYHCVGLMLLPDVLSPVSAALDIVFVATHAILCVCIMYFAVRWRKGWYQVCAVTKLVHWLAVVFVFGISVVAEAVVQGRGKQVLLEQPLVLGEMAVLVVDGLFSGLLCYCGSVMSVGRRNASRVVFGP